MAVVNPKYPRLSSGDTINRTLLQKVSHKWCFTVNEILGNQLINYLTCQSLQYTACHSHESEVSPLHAMNSKINTKGRVNNTSSFPVFVLVALFSKDINSLRTLSKCECLISGKKTNSRGVAILFQHNFEYKLIDHGSDDNGNFLYVDINIGSISLRVINLYAPNTDTPSFFQDISSLIEENTLDHLLLCGDFNLVLSPEMDSSNYVSINNPRSREVLLDTINLHNLKDAFRHFHPNMRRYTWHRKNPIKQARLDYFIVSNAFTDLLSQCNILPGYRSDRSILELTMEISKFERGKGLWKLNCNLLTNADYVNLVNDTIQEVKLQYAVPVYSLDFLNSTSDFDLFFTIEEDLLLEIILFKIRAKTIKFASTLRKAERSLELDLINKIGAFEKDEALKNSTLEIDNLKKKLQSLRESKLKGNFVRSRLQWLQFGEKPSQYFCSLEHKHYVDKTIRKICCDNGEIITEQKKILHQVKEYYVKLFKNKDSELDTTKLSEVIDLSQIEKINPFSSIAIRRTSYFDRTGKCIKKYEKQQNARHRWFSIRIF